jgi:hypothetical protein
MKKARGKMKFKLSFEPEDILLLFGIVVLIIQVVRYN